MKAIRGRKVTRCAVSVNFDEFGNVIGNVYIRKVSESDGRLVNSVIKTYPDVSQFWTYDKPRSSRIRSTRATIRRRRTWSNKSASVAGQRSAQLSGRDRLTMQFWIIQGLNSLSLGVCCFCCRRASR